MRYIFARGKVAIRLLLCLGLTGCPAPSVPSARSLQTTQANRLSFPFPHGIVVYVNPLNCKLGAEEIEGLTALDSLRGVSILVVLVTPSMVDTLALDEIRMRLNLPTPSRLGTVREVERFEAVVGTATPIVVVVRSGAAKAILLGDLAPSRNTARAMFTRGTA